METSRLVALLDQPTRPVLSGFYRRLFPDSLGGGEGGIPSPAQKAYSFPTACSKSFFFGRDNELPKYITAAFFEWTINTREIIRHCCNRKGADLYVKCTKIRFGTPGLRPDPMGERMSLCAPPDPLAAMGSFFSGEGGKKREGKGGAYL